MRNARRGCQHSRGAPEVSVLVDGAFPLNMLSGGVTPIDGMPQWLQNALQISPTTHFVTFALAILYRGAGLDLVGKEFCVVALIGTVFFAIALARSL